jgi:uncharacterized membrane protein
MVMVVIMMVVGLMVMVEMMVVMMIGCGACGRPQSYPTSDNTVLLQ